MMKTFRTAASLALASLVLMGCAQVEKTDYERSERYVYSDKSSAFTQKVLPFMLEWRISVVGSAPAQGASQDAGAGNGQGPVPPGQDCRAGNPYIPKNTCQ